MKLADAKKLHSKDEVTVKKSGETIAIIDAWLSEDGKTVFIDCCTHKEGYVTLTHKEIK